MSWYPLIRASYTQLMLQSLLVMSLYAFSSDGKSINSRHQNITCLSSEREALLKFKDEISHDYCGLMTSWGNLQHGNLDCCMWNGVTCSRHSGHVTGLILSGYDQLNACLDSRVISPSLGELKNLMYLDLSYNNFHGVAIPNSIGTLINLRKLNLLGSRFSGEVPNNLENLTRLTFLDLRLNDGLYVESLNWLSRLTMLEGVYLSGTDLSKAKDWSRIVGSLHRLEVLYMDGCVLSLPMPTSSLQSPNLNTISLSGNRFNNSSVFQWLFNTIHSDKVLERSLNYLDLSSNSLQGPIPNRIGNLVSLTYLNLSDNSFSNNLPRTIKNLEFLVYLDLSHNSLTLSGTLHDTFGQFELLRYLDLSRNLISGTLPDPLGNLEFFEYLDLSRNSLSGSIPHRIGDASSLTHLSLSHNALEGTIPILICNLERLTYLDLSHNLLEGPINDKIEYLDSLTHLDLSHNSLSGTIPDTIGNLYSLTYLDLSYNSLSGKLPDSIWNLGSLAHLGFSHNPLTALTGHVEVNDKGGDKINIGLYVSIGLGIYAGFCGFWATLAMKDHWRWSYFKFLDHMIHKFFVRVAPYIAGYRREE
ncbi:hypothetical protein vseg_012040 [Gypsophila vaccaria]